MLSSEPSQYNIQVLSTGLRRDYTVETPLPTGTRWFSENVSELVTGSGRPSAQLEGRAESSNWHIATNLSLISYFILTFQYLGDFKKARMVTEALGPLNSVTVTLRRSLGWNK